MWNLMDAFFYACFFCFATSFKGPPLKENILWVVRCVRTLQLYLHLKQSNPRRRRNLFAIFCSFLILINFGML